MCCGIMRDTSRIHNSNNNNDNNYNMENFQLSGIPIVLHFTDEGKIVWVV